MKKNSARQYAVALYQAAKDAKKDELPKIINNFTALLAKNHNLKMAKQIIAELTKHAKAEEGISEIEITSAGSLDDKTINAIKKIFGEKVESHQTTDKSIIGGIIIRTQDHILDASVKTQLLKLKQKLI